MALVNQTKQVPTQAMATFAVTLSALVGERETALLTRLAADYNLNIEELRSKYSEIPLSHKVRGVRGPTKPSAAPCKGTTAKGVACKFSALPGCEFCKRHSREPKPVEPKPAKEKKAKKDKEVPMHSHDLDGEFHADCVLCKDHGPFTLPEVPAQPNEEEIEEYYNKKIE